MTNVAQRFVMFFTFVPALVFLVLGLPGYNHLVLQILVILFAFGVALECAFLFDLVPPRKSTARFFFFLLLGCIVLLPLVVEVFGLAGYGSALYVWAAFALALFLVFTHGIVQSERQGSDKLLPTLGAWLVILWFPLFGLDHVLKLLAFPKASPLLLVFFASVFLNDSFAYIGGRFFGKKSPHPLKLSPNKTLMGFIWGFVTSPLVVLASEAIEPSLFPSYFQALVLGLLMGSSTILGDLFESSLKRSVGAKDTGAVILGRGGLLDSCDSLLFSAPLFYYAYLVLGG